MPARTRILAVLCCLMGAPRRAAEDTLRQEVGPVGTFTLRDCQGRNFSPAELIGKFWVAHFFFTTCTSGCSQTTESMKRLQKSFADNPNVAFVSISLNNDSPEVLQTYAAGVEANLQQWHILTGPIEQVHPIVKDHFKVPVEKTSDPNPGNAISHSFQLMLVNREGVIAGYVDGKNPDEVASLENELRGLAGERPLLPAVNAGLNATCAVLLVTGWIAIRRRRETTHKLLMLAALGVSAVFLTSYLYYHIVIQGGQPTRYQGEGWPRIAYFSILLTHTVLAAAVAPLALIVAYQGLRDQRPRHVRLAKWTLPIWLYVSVTGVIVYVMLYQI